MTTWLQQGTTGSHPFGTYCSYYKDSPCPGRTGLLNVLISGLALE
jgi:hypothetical protein